MLDPRNLAIAKATIDAFCIAVSLDPGSHELWVKANEIRRALGVSQLDPSGSQLHYELYVKEADNEVQKASTL